MTALSVDEFHAMEFYVSSGYKSINRSMMNVEEFDGTRTEESYKAIIQNIHSALDRNILGETLPTLYRGTRQQFIEHYNEGDEVEFPFFVSASTDPVIAARFAGEEEPAVLVINGISGRYALTSLTTDEKEVLISPFSRFKVDTITRGVSFQPEYDSTGFYAPARKNVTVVELTVL
jgi:hypothetical protein